MTTKEIIDTYETINAKHKGFGRLQAIELAENFTDAELEKGAKYGFKVGNKSIWNTFLTARGFKRNGVEV